MKAYSIDLRERVVAACDAGDSTREQIAARFSVSVSWIRDLLKRRRQTGSIEPRPRGGLVEGRRSAPRSRSWPRPPASPAAPRRCIGRWGGWASREKKVAAGG